MRPLPCGRKQNIPLGGDQSSVVPEAGCDAGTLIADHDVIAHRALATCQTLLYGIKPPLHRGGDFLTQRR